MRFDIKTYDEVTSTNDVVKRAIADGAPEGTAVVARTQTGGYGRRGNAWASDPGGLYLSVLLRPQRPADEVAALSLVTALAVRRALASFLPEDSADAVQIKWPNDVVVMRDDGSAGPFRKICGISLEQKQGALCIGIGVNVARARCARRAGAGDATPAPVGGSPRSKNVPVYLEDMIPGDAPAVDAVRDAVLAELSSAYELWQREGFAALRGEFMRHFALAGFRIRIDETGDARPVRCEVRGVSERGHLMVLPEGERELREIAAGTVTIDR